MRARILVSAALLAGFLTTAAPSTSAAPPTGKMELRSHYVADLVIPVEPVKAFPPTAPENWAKPAKTLEKDIMKLLVSTIAPATWQENGGCGTIDYHPLTMSLVVNQTQEVQEQIADLLAALRRLHDQEVALEVKILTVPDGLERLGINAGLSVPRSNVQFLDDAQVRSLLEAAQGDARTHITQAPKITLFNGQQGTLSVPDGEHFITGLELGWVDGNTIVTPKVEPSQTGFRLTTLPVLTTDRRFVRLGCKVEHTTLAAVPVPTVPVTIPAAAKKADCIPVTQLLQRPAYNVQMVETTVSIPDGGTVLIGGLKKVSEVRTDRCLMTLGHVPCMNRLFHNVGSYCEAQRVFVLVTPRIVIHEEEERQTGYREPEVKTCRGSCEAQSAEACLKGEAAPMRRAHVLAELLQA